ncbi:hypothetical protein P4S72_15165 [Vibrio sp. PP-XX7]
MADNPAGCRSAEGIHTQTGYSLARYSADCADPDCALYPTGDPDCRNALRRIDTHQKIVPDPRAPPRTIASRLCYRWISPRTDVCSITGLCRPYR